MASLRNLRPQHRKTLEYFDKYDYPLTKEELEYWAGAKVQRLPARNASHPPASIREAFRAGSDAGGKGSKQYYFLSARSKLVNLRNQREKYSLLKWGIAYKHAARLAKLPFVAAIFVTGSLAMSNCKRSDDIDLMIITYPDTLWITRFIATLMFWQNRRLPGQKTAPNKICTNLWLESGKLKVESRSLYHAHEILQAKCIFDRGGIQYQFLKQNSWVKEYLLVAFKSQIKNSKAQINSKLQVTNLKFVIYLVIRILNLGFYLMQYLYMLPKKSTEKVGLGFAFFHPAKTKRA